MDINKKPLVISLNGGLGNQLFILFAGISKAIDENRNYLIYLENNNRVFYFDNFLKHLHDKVINYNNYNINIINIYNEPFFHYQEIPNNYDMIKGYFQSSKYFDHNLNELFNIFKINQNKNNYKLNLKSIGIHFRIGDYINLQHYHRILSFIYYVKAINYLKNNLPDFDEYTFIIFGEKNNDTLINDFIKEINFNLNKSINYIKIYDRYNNINDYEEFFYMSNCNHLIIANSTYSWFAAYLNNNNNKIIIHPSKNKWFADEISNIVNLKDLFLNDWIEIDY